MQVLIALDKAFGLTCKDSSDQMAAALVGAMLGDTSLTIIVHALDVQLAFLMVHADKIVGTNACEKTLLLINSGIVHEEFRYKLHPVIRWLRSLAREPLPQVM